MLRFLADRQATPPPAGRATDADDRALLGRVAAGDPRAFEALYRAYHPRLNRFLGLMTRRDLVVEECVNDTMLVVWNRAASYNGECKVSTWVFAIAYRTACKALRRQDEAVEDAHADEAASDDPGPEQRRAGAETRAALASALQGLSHEHRGVLVLTYFHDLPQAEIACIMACPVDTVKTRMFHARRRLRALLSGELGDWL